MYEISEELLKALLGYLSGCQYDQVEGLIAGIRQCKASEPVDGTAKESEDAKT